MKKRLLTLFLAICMICTLLPFDAFADNIETVSYDVTYKQTEARSMLKMVNDFRTGNEAWQWNKDDTQKVYVKGLGNLVYDYTLEKIAMQRAAEIAIQYSHTRPNNWYTFSFFDPTPGLSQGENIAAGYTSAQDVFEGWQETNDPYAGQGHRRNMLDTDYTAIGIACVEYNGYLYWVQEFYSYRYPDTTATEANDSKTTVNTDIAMSAVTSVDISTDAETPIIVAPGKSVKLPDVTTKILMTNSWPGRDCEVTPNYTWKSSDPSIVKIENGKIIGAAAGSATITVSALGSSLDIPVMVHTHSYTSKVTKPTCMDKGYTTHICSGCGGSYKDDYKEALGHDYTYKANRNPTAGAEGELIGTCSRCDKTVTVTLPKLNKTDYTYKVTKAATCTETGTASYTWNTTEYGTFSFAVTLPKTAHSTAINGAKDATCTAKGYTGDKVCKNCGQTVEKGKETAALGHNYKDGVCTVCGAKGSSDKPATKNPFVDVKKADYYYDSVLWAYYHDPQITTGVDKTHFAPGNNCTRGQIVTFLWRASGCPEVKGVKNPFKDVKSSDYYYDAVLWAVSEKITTGIDNTHFAPNNTCTRAQSVTFMWRAEGQHGVKDVKNPFKDVKTSDYYYNAVLWALGKNITNGVDNTHFAPNNTCTRGQIVTFLYRDRG